jgi:hypothetical protein
MHEKQEDQGAKSAVSFQSGASGGRICLPKGTTVVREDPGSE